MKMSTTLVFPALLTITASCIVTAPPLQAPPPQAPTTATGPSAPTTTTGFPTQYEGFYDNSEWGAMLIQSTPNGRVRAAYTHDQGTVEGVWVGNKIVGWWCEAPTRAPNGDAGEVELTFLADASGVHIDGRWRYGTSANEPTWRENWDVTRTANQAPPIELAERLRDDSAFCAPPR